MNPSTCIVLGLDDGEHMPDEQVSSQNAHTIESTHISVAAHHESTSGRCQLS